MQPYPYQNELTVAHHKGIEARIMFFDLRFATSNFMDAKGFNRLFFALYVKTNLAHVL
jgi:hypothetical protein